MANYDGIRSLQGREQAIRIQELLLFLEQNGYSARQKEKGDIVIKFKDTKYMPEKIYQVWIRHRNMTEKYIDLFVKKE